MLVDDRTHDPRKAPPLIERTPPETSIEDRISTLLVGLHRSGPLRRDQVAIPGTAVTLEIVRPMDIDALLDHVVDDPEQNLPYWAELWPSGIALAAAIAHAPDLVRGMPVLELGSGLGITAALALAAGADLIATDYAPESLLLTRANCLRHTGCEPRTLRMNWRAPDDAPIAAVPNAASGFPVVLAADVLYERRDIGPLLTLVERIVAPGGMLWLAEPGRAPAAAFLDEAALRGWKVSTDQCGGPWPDPDDAGVVVSVHRLQRDSPPGV